MSREQTERRPTLLLVDDEARILTALRRTLRREGYELLTAGTAAEAIRVLEERPVDLILSDQKMPGMSGLALLAEVARRQPTVARLLITGWTEAVPPEELKKLDVKALVPKPWEDAELKQVLRDVLEAR